MSTQVSYTPTLPQSNAGCSGLLSMLTEPSPQLIHSALSKIYSLVSTHWHELSPHISLIEKLSEPWNESGIQLPQNTRNIAIAIASRVYYFLEDRKESLRLALSLLGTEYFDVVKDKSDYVEGLVWEAIGSYIAKTKGVDGVSAQDPSTDTEMDTAADTEAGNEIGTETELEKVSSFRPLSPFNAPFAPSTSNLYITSRPPPPPTPPPFTRNIPT